MRKSADTASEKSEKAEIKNKNSEESESRASEEAEVCIIRVTKETEEQDVNKLVKNEFFIRRARTADKKEFIISSKNTSFLSILFFLKSRDSEKVKRITII